MRKFLGVTFPSLAIGAFFALSLACTALAQIAQEPTHKDHVSQIAGNIYPELPGIGGGDRPEWWGGAGHPEPRMWGGWDHRNETWMHVLDVPTTEHPLLRLGFFQQLTTSGGLRYREAWVYVAHHPPDYLVAGKWRAWHIRVDTGYAWRYLGYWRPGDGWDAVVVERELPGLVEFCEGDTDGQVWVVVEFDRPAMFLGYWSGYEYLPRTYTYGAGLTSEFGGGVDMITRWPVPYQSPPCYIQWTGGGHRVW